MSDPSAFLNALLAAYKLHYDDSDGTNLPINSLTPPFVTTLIGALFWTPDDKGAVTSVSRLYVEQLRTKNRLSLLQEYIQWTHCTTDVHG